MTQEFEKQQMRTNKILVIIAIMGSILTIIGLIFTYYQIQINSNNAKLYEQTIRPNLKISSYNLDSRFDVYHRNMIATINLDGSSGTFLDFFITNIGKIDAKWISITINNSWATNARSNFENISSGEVKFGQLAMTTKECQDWILFGESQGKSLDSCKASENNLSFGKQDIVFKIECVNCDPPIQYQRLEVCIENRNNSIC